MSIWNSSVVNAIITLPVVEINVFAPNVPHPGKNPVSTKLCPSLDVILPGELFSLMADGRGKEGSERRDGMFQPCGTLGAG